ncbi:hypothetical protein BH10CHL1_BH10CHL1_33630 [soil metagenome]
MSETAPKWHFLMDLLIPHPTTTQLLLLQDGAYWRLPRLESADTSRPLLYKINDEVRQKLGIEVTNLRLVAEQTDKATHQIRQIYLQENHSLHEEPPVDGRWVGAIDLDTLTFSLPEQRAIIEQWLIETASGKVSSLRAAWMRPGWHAEATAWIQTTLEQLGYHLSGPIQEIKNWVISRVLRAPTDQGDFYFKVSGGSPLFVNEARVIQGLAQCFPDRIPAPRAIDAARNWMLLADFGSEIGWQAPLTVREAVLTAFGRLQIDATQQIDELFAIGCLDRRLDKLAEQIDPLVNDATMLAYMSKTDGVRLQALAPRLKMMCATLASYKVPQTLVHGDMHMSNVARPHLTAEGDGFVFFDWTDACITHPFLDMIDILHEEDIAVQTRLRDSYLGQWTAYEPMERLLEMWGLAAPLCALHQAVSYQHIIANTEPAAKHEMAWAMPTWFGKILASVQG